MPVRIRALGDADRQVVHDLLRRDPVENLFVASRISTCGIDRLGCTLWGCYRGRELVALCHAGGNLVPVCADDEALAAFASKIGHRRWTQSIMGNAQQVLRLHELLVAWYGDSWAHPRQIRPHQPLLVMDHDPQLPGNPDVRHVGEDELQPYFEAAVRMYTEEVGVSPLDGGGSYRAYVSTLIAQRRAFGWVRDAKVIFKSDIGAATGQYCQVQGVWLEPGLRGQGLSVPAMASVVVLCRRQFPVVSLYVNDYNIRALRLYQTIGFRRYGELATVLY